MRHFLRNAALIAAGYATRSVLRSATRRAVKSGIAALSEESQIKLFGNKVPPSKDPVLLLFISKKCSQCHTKELKKFVDDIKKDKFINLYIVDYEEYPQIFKHFYVNLTPTLLYVPDGVDEESKVFGIYDGDYSLSSLKKFINERDINSSKCKKIIGNDIATTNKETILIFISNNCPSCHKIRFRKFIDKIKKNINIDVKVINITDNIYLFKKYGAGYTPDIVYVPCGINDKSQIMSHYIISISGHNIDNFKKFIKKHAHHTDDCITNEKIISVFKKIGIIFNELLLDKKKISTQEIKDIKNSIIISNGHQGKVIPLNGKYMFSYNKLTDGKEYYIIVNIDFLKNKIYKNLLNDYSLFISTNYIVNSLEIFIDDIRSIPVKCVPEKKKYKYYKIFAENRSPDLIIYNLY